MNNDKNKTLSSLEDKVKGVAERISEQQHHAPNQHENRQERSEYITNSVGFLVNKVIERLRGIYPAWRYSFPTEEEEFIFKKELLALMIEKGVHHQAQIDAGLKRCSEDTKDFPPKAIKLVKWCLRHKDLIGHDEAKKVARFLTKVYNFQRFDTVNPFEIKAKPLTIEIYKRIDFDILTKSDEEKVIEHVQAIHSGILAGNWQQPKINQNVLLEHRPEFLGLPPALVEDSADE